MTTRYAILLLSRLWRLPAGCAAVALAVALLPSARAAEYQVKTNAGDVVQGEYLGTENGMVKLRSKLGVLQIAAKDVISMKEVAPGARAAVDEAKDGGKEDHKQVAKETTVTPPPPAEAKSAADYLRLAVECIKQEDYQGAVKWCGEAIALDGQNAELYLLRARAKGALNDNGGVIEDCSRAIKLDPKNIGAIGLRAYAKLYADDPKSAIRDFAAAIRLDAKNAEWYQGRGQANEATDNHKSALSDFDTSLKLQPGDLGTLKLRAPVRQELGDLDGALEDIEQVVRARPDDREAANLRDGLLNAIGEQEVAAAKRSWVKLRQDQAQQMVRRILGDPSWTLGNRWYYSYDFAIEPGWVDFGGRSARVEQFREPVWKTGGFKRGKKRGEQ